MTVKPQFFGMAAKPLPLGRKWIGEKLKVSILPIQKFKPDENVISRS